MQTRQNSFMRPKLDYMFKRIFGNPKNKLILIDLINTILIEKNKPPINDLEIVNPNIDKESLHDKTSNLDIRAMTIAGDTINIEIQLRKDSQFHIRADYYLNRLYIGQMKEGMEYVEGNRVIVISIIDFHLFHNDVSGNTDYVPKESDSNEVLFELKGLHFLELPKFRKLRKGLNQLDDTAAMDVINRMDKLNKWMYFIDSDSNKHWEALAMNEPAIQQAITEAHYLSQDAEAREQYEMRIMAIMDERSRLRTAMNDGFKKGEARGRAKGKAEGKAEGKLEALYEVAKNMLHSGMSVEQVVHYTKLDIETVASMKH